MGEGKKRQIRETGRLLGLPVVKIIRLRIGTLKLGTLKPNQWRYLTADEIAELKGEEIAPKPKINYARRPAPKPVSKDKPKRPPANRTGKPFKKSSY
jgi:23S rRNA pseudouridine2605 synthase